MKQEVQVFIDYVLDFYSNDKGIYPFNCKNEDISKACVDYYNLCKNPASRFEWGDGDSVDRLRVRAILEGSGYYECI